MKALLSFILAAVFFTQTADAQKIFSTRNGKISFTSPADGEVKAVNNEVTSRIADNGQVTFSLLVKGFRFQLAEMQEHFNDQYLESNKYPRADFKGNIVNLKDVNFAKDGSYKATVKGDLTLHGVTKSITANGTVEIKAGKPVVSCKFNVTLKDFNVSTSGVGQTIAVDVSCQYQ
ncbi:YceI family protein [Sediminibacterium roseum]|uniref:YceI family protein n=1 Tax=Sediminibacterium roseum TaxID=1978412 RepID=A0ABW9ZPU8_9BACT|nr:YceI family protein [Sediminibacterium roseum]NCI48502.1 YceI family protein [Sediminibacterium roseum]